MINLTVERTKHGWSRAELARRAHMHPAQVGQIEAQRLVPYPVQLRKLANALEYGGSPQQLMEDHNDEER